MTGGETTPGGQTARWRSSTKHDGQNLNSGCHTWILPHKQASTTGYQRAQGAPALAEGVPGVLEKPRSQARGMSPHPIHLSILWGGRETQWGLRTGSRAWRDAVMNRCFRNERRRHQGEPRRQGRGWQPATLLQGQLVKNRKYRKKCIVLLFFASHYRPLGYCHEHKRCNSWPQEAHFLVDGKDP